MESDFVSLYKVPFQQESAYSELINFYDSEGLYDAVIKLFQKHINPEWIKEKNILIKPNWVKHSSNTADDLCLRTNDRFVLTATKAILKMQPRKVVIGDAPIQGCNWEKMINETFIGNLSELSSEFFIPISVKDFRRRKYNANSNFLTADVNPESDYIIVDLANNSLLEPITKPGINNFRVTQYNPDRMLIAHGPGVHKYCITKELFAADVVFSLPKIKTHEKTCITGAIKNLVGLNGDKDFLPHHRIGGISKGGDCYPGGSYLRLWSELLLDNANRRLGRRSFYFWQKLSSLLWWISRPGLEYNRAAGWYGNDTTWRMVRDINYLIEYADAEGSFHDLPQRKLFSLCDGVIAGQGDGPLSPEPIALGVISLSNNTILNDIVYSLLMKIPPTKIPLLKEYFNTSSKVYKIFLNGRDISLEDIDNHSVSVKPPKGWISYINSFR